MNTLIADRIRKYHYRFDANETLCMYFVIAALITTTGALVFSYGDLYLWWWIFQKENNWLDNANICLGKSGSSIISLFGIFLAYAILHTQTGHLRYYLRTKLRNTKFNSIVSSRVLSRLIPSSDVRGHGNYRAKGMAAIVLTILITSPVVVYMASNGDYWIVFYAGIPYLVFTIFALMALYLMPLVIVISLSRKSLLYIRSAMVDSLLDVHRALIDGRDLWVVAEMLNRARDRLSSYCIRFDTRNAPSWVKGKFNGHAAYLTELYGWCLVPSVSTRHDLINELDFNINNWAQGSLDKLTIREATDVKCHERRWVLLIVAVIPLFVVLGFKWTGIVQLDVIDYSILGLIFLSILYWSIGGSLMGLRGAIEDAVASSIKRIGAG